MPVRVLLNPSSQGGGAARRWRALEPLARSLFPSLEVHASRHAGELTEIAARLAPLGGLVLAAGGDGTSHEVINGLTADRAAGRAAMGWLPLGSGNDLARGVGVPLDPRVALEGYRDPVYGAIDVGTIDCRDQMGRPMHRVFGNSFTIGVSTDVLELVARFGNPLGGKLSYFVATIVALARHQPVKLTLDGRAAGYRLLSITNGATFGAGMRITPGARLDDGQLDLLAVDAVSRLRTAAVFPRIYWGGHLDDPSVETRRVTALEIGASGPLAFEADGELYHAQPPVHIAIRPGALRVARPKPRRLDSTP
jgi:diacylglycerol kinase (ATP)